MDNSERIGKLSPDMIHRISFARSREEGGINVIYDPFMAREVYQVFIHTLLPLEELQHWEFSDFEDARRFASIHFAAGWEVLEWDGKVDRPCARGEGECNANNPESSCHSHADGGGGCGLE